MSVGPMHLMVVGFEKPEFKGEIIDQMNTLRDWGIVRLIDALMVHKSQSGEMTAVETTDLSLGERVELGAIIGGLFGLGATGTMEGAKESAQFGAELVLARNDYGVREEEIEEIAAGIPRGSAALILLLEHRWAIGLRQAVLNTGGVLLAQGLLDPISLIRMGDMVAKASEAAEDRERAKARP